MATPELFPRKFICRGRVNGATMPQITIKVRIQAFSSRKYQLVASPISSVKNSPCKMPTMLSFTMYKKAPCAMKQDNAITKLV